MRDSSIHYGRFCLAPQYYRINDTLMTVEEVYDLLSECATHDEISDYLSRLPHEIRSDLEYVLDVRRKTSNASTRKLKKST